jgi:hypothetical protein
VQLRIGVVQLSKVGTVSNHQELVPVLVDFHIHESPQSPTFSIFSFPSIPFIATSTKIEHEQRAHDPTTQRAEYGQYGHMSIVCRAKDNPNGALFSKKRRRTLLCGLMVLRQSVYQLLRYHRTMS